MRSPRVYGSSNRSNGYYRSSSVKQRSSGKRSVSPQKTEGKSLLKRAVAGAAVGAAIGVGLAAAPTGAIVGAATLAVKSLVEFAGSVLFNGKVPAAVTTNKKSYEKAKKVCSYGTVAAGILSCNPILIAVGFAACARCK